MRFTENFLRGLTAKEKDYKLTEDGAKGDGRLVFKVRTSGLKEFYYRYRIDDSDKTVKLGRYRQNPTDTGITLAEARQKLQTAVAEQKDHGDVKEYRRLKAAAQRLETQRLRKIEERGSFQQMLDGYVDSLRAAGKSSAKDVAPMFDRYISRPFPELMTKKASEITPTDLQTVLARMVGMDIKRCVNKLRSYLSAAFAWAAKSDYDPARMANAGVTFQITSNPAALIPHKREYDRTGERNLNKDELQKFWQATYSQSPIIGAFLRFNLILGGQRISQLLRAKWSDLDLEAKTITLRDSKGRGGIRDHLLPLTQLAFQHLTPSREWQDSSEWIFSTDGKVPVTPWTISHAVSDIASSLHEEHGIQRFEARDLRRTTETLLASIGVTKEIRAHILSHGRSTGVQAKHYDRHLYLEEKRDALRHWETWLVSFLRSAEAGSDIN
jgi:integrase